MECGDGVLCELAHLEVECGADAERFDEREVVAGFDVAAVHHDGCFAGYGTFEYEAIAAVGVELRVGLEEG